MILKTHRELVELHGKEVTYHYKKRTLVGMISVRHRKDTQYIYLCNNHYGKSCKVLKVEESFGYDKAHMISYSTGLGQYQFKNSKIKRIQLLKESPKKKKKLFIRVECKGLNTRYKMYKDFEESLNNMDKVKKGENDMIIGVCPECGEHKITSYDGLGCVNVNCSSCVLSIASIIKIKQRDDERRTDLLKGFNIITEEKPMSNKTEALKEITEIKKRMLELERIISKPETFEVKTPISAGTRSTSILFNGNTQSLFESTGTYGVGIGNFLEYSKDHAWLPCARKDLEIGDTVHFIPCKYKDHFSNTATVGKVLENNEIVYVSSEGNIIKTNKYYEYYYKLIHKDEV